MAAAPVLYVEDEENDVLFMRIAFEQAKIPVDLLKVVTNGVLAIDYLAGHGHFADRQQYPLPCIVLLDLNLPVRTGFEVLQWIREQDAFKSLPVIILSSSGRDYDQQMTKGLGADEFYVKSALPQDMLRLVEALKTRWLKNCGNRIRVQGETKS